MYAMAGGLLGARIENKRTRANYGHVAFVFAFSRKYFVLADDEQRVRKHLPDSFMQLLAKESGILARISNNDLLLAHDRGIRAKDALRLAELAFAVMECR